ncbi:MAG: sigma-70 family RNA polymerase sigma factor [Phycisphaerales bacterium]|nr:MAG: sigma-70 family RNA polymerase sigma factor [Phycisphaerales bacterium]
MVKNADSDRQDVTLMLVAATDGDASAAVRLLPVVYDELRRLASGFLRRERPDHTLQATALVHEAYLRLVDPSELHFENRAQFFSIAATAMRRILVNHAKARARLKRGGGLHRVEFNEDAAAANTRHLDLVALDEAMDRLAEIDPKKAQIVEMRYFGGLTEAEIARAIDVSPRSVRRGWVFARSWLRSELARKLEIHQ